MQMEYLGLPSPLAAILVALHHHNALQPEQPLSGQLHAARFMTYMYSSRSITHYQCGQPSKATISSRSFFQCKHREKKSV